MKAKWTAFGAVIVLSFAVLGWTGSRIYQMAPPIPSEVRTESGQVVLTGDDIEAGQNVWQSMGGMELGSIWGHGSYVAPDWTADWLHREATGTLDKWGHEQFGRAYELLEPEQQAALRQRLTDQYRTNRYDAATGRLMVSSTRAQVIEDNLRYYAGLFKEGRVESRDSRRHADRRDTRTPAWRLLLLDLVGGVHEQTRVDGDLHQQLAA
ncbi:MAG: hypothetical protein U0Q11_03375 [Vicinamibacterales bacterium]